MTAPNGPPPHGRGRALTGAVVVRQGMVGHFAMGNGTVEEDEP